MFTWPGLEWIRNGCLLWAEPVRLSLGTWSYGSGSCVWLKQRTYKLERWLMAVREKQKKPVCRERKEWNKGTERNRDESLHDPKVKEKQNVADLVPGGFPAPGLEASWDQHLLPDLEFCEILISLCSYLFKIAQKGFCYLQPKEPSPKYIA